MRSIGAKERKNERKKREKKAPEAGKYVGNNSCVYTGIKMYIRG